MRRLVGTLAAVAILSGGLGAAQAQGYRPPRDGASSGASAPRQQDVAGMFAGFIVLNFPMAFWLPNPLISLAALWRYTDAPPPPELAAPLTALPDAGSSELAVEPLRALPEEATTGIVTEPEPGENAAPATAMSPRPRPERVAEDAPGRAVEAAIADAVEQSAGTPLQKAPPLTASEKDAFRAAVMQCWNIGSLGAQAMATTVVVSAAISRDGRPEAGSIRMRAYSGGNEAAARQAYEAARRAIIRCGATGYDLPIGKYQQWREIEMTFNPESMRIR